MAVLRLWDGLAMTDRARDTSPQELDSVQTLDAVRRVRAAAERHTELPEHEIASLRAASGSVREADRQALLNELTAILLVPESAYAFDTLARVGLLAALLPEVDALGRMAPGDGRHKDVYRHTLQVVARSPLDPIARWAALMHDVGKPATKTVERGAVHFPGHAEVGADLTRRRLRALGMTKETAGPIVLLVALHLRVNSYEQEWTDSAARRLARDAGEQFDRLLDLSRADVTSARPAQVERALRRVDALAAHVEALRAEENRPRSPIDGAELMELFGRPPGRWIATVKDHLAALVGAGDLAPDDTGSARTIAERLVAEIDGGGVG